MDYLRIYNELIEHRKMMPILESEYYESHHITPRSMGGTDEKENLIHLTAEDHYIAHLLLAKAYGGGMWAAARLMQIMKVGRRKVRHRRMFGIVRREFAKAMSTMMLSDTKYEFYHVDQDKVYHCTQKELRDMFDLTQQESSKIASGMILKRLVLNSLKDSVGYYPQRTFVNIETKEEYVMQPNEFIKRFGLNGHSIYSLVAGKQLTSQGFVMKENAHKDLTFKPKDSTKYALEVIETGEIIHLTKYQLHKEYGIARMSVDMLISGKLKKSGGFRLSKGQEMMSA